MIFYPLLPHPRTLLFSPVKAKAFETTASSPQSDGSSPGYLSRMSNENELSLSMEDKKLRSLYLLIRE